MQISRSTTFTVGESNTTKLLVASANFIIAKGRFIVSFPGLTASATAYEGLVTIKNGSSILARMQIKTGTPLAAGTPVIVPAPQDLLSPIAISNDISATLESFGGVNITGGSINLDFIYETVF